MSSPAVLRVSWTERAVSSSLYHSPKHSRLLPSLTLPNNRDCPVSHQGLACWLTNLSSGVLGRAML